MRRSQRKREIIIDLMNPDLLEMLAKLEHEQWSHWMKYEAVNFSLENQERWLSQAHSPYDILSEKEKESDREWAKKVLNAINDWWWKQH